MVSSAWVNVYDIIQAIETAAVNPGSSETQSLLAARHSVPACNEGIRSYVERMDKTEALLLKVGFRSYPSIQIHYLKLHVEEFSQTPQGKIFQQTVMDWDKKHEYGKTFLTEHWTELLDMVVAVYDRRRKAPGYNPEYDIVDGAVTGNKNV